MPTAPIILFDGVCNLCNAAINWIIDHDPNQIFRFASLQSLAARQLLPDMDSLPDSIVLIDEAGIHTRSTAALRIARRLGRLLLVALLLRFAVKNQGAHIPRSPRAVCLSAASR